MTVNHSGAYRDTQSSVHPTIDPWTTLDMQLNCRTAKGHQLGDDIEFAVNVTNIFNKNPPFVDWQWGYDALGTIPVGRVIGLYGQKKW
jgi:outer membrane receptor protein involved in Fe transport